LSVQVNNLSKHYGSQKAVNNISFEVEKGQILGFLGPNGAGKTTTMKIISCFIPQTEGDVTVCGHSVSDNPIAVRHEIGYLPENNPLYYDMYVREYLGFVANLHKKKLGKNTQARVAEMVELTGLQREQHKKIRHISKGYKQRVGLAQAMIHDPQVLILDEPTSGLDPNQLAEIRGVIKALGKEKTVILSTHIMQEVQAMCDRVIIINKGNLVADDTPENLQQYGRKSLITVEFANAINEKLLGTLPHIENIIPLAANKYQLTTKNNADIRADIFNFAIQQKRTLLTLHQETANLEEVFRQLTA